MTPEAKSYAEEFELELARHGADYYRDVALLLQRHREGLTEERALALLGAMHLGFHQLCERLLAVGWCIPSPTELRALTVTVQAEVVRRNSREEAP